MRWRIDRVTVHEDGALWLVIWRAPGGREAVETVHLGVRSELGCIRTVQRLAGLAAQAGVPVEELTPETLVGLCGSPASVHAAGRPQPRWVSRDVTPKVMVGVRSHRRRVIVPTKPFKMMTFAQRKDGRLVYRINSKLEARGLVRLSQEQVDWLAVTGHGDEVLRAVRREMRQLRYCIELASREGEERAATGFQFLRMEARLMQTRIQRLIPPED